MTDATEAHNNINHHDSSTGNDTQQASESPASGLSESALLLARREAERQRTPSVFNLPLARH